MSKKCLVLLRKIVVLKRSLKTIYFLHISIAQGTNNLYLYPLDTDEAISNFQVNR